MPDARINDLPVIPAYDDDDRLPLVDQSEGVDGTTSQTTLQNYENARVAPLITDAGQRVFKSFTVNPDAAVTQGRFVSLRWDNTIEHSTTGRDLFTPRNNGATVDSGQAFSQVHIAKLTDEKTVVGYFDPDAPGSINFNVVDFSNGVGTAGTPSEFKSASALETADISALTSTTFIFAYRDASAGNRARAVVGTVSGTSISYGTEIDVNSTNVAQNIGVVACTATQGLIVWSDVSDTDNGKAAVFTITSGDTITLGTILTFETGTFSTTLRGNNIIVRLADDRALCSYIEQTGDNDILARVLDFTGTGGSATVTAGSSAGVTSSGDHGQISVLPFTETEFLIFYTDVPEADLFVRAGFIDSTTITFPAAAKQFTFQGFSDVGAIASVVVDESNFLIMLVAGLGPSGVLELFMGHYNRGNETVAENIEVTLQDLGFVTGSGQDLDAIRINDNAVYLAYQNNVLSPSQGIVVRQYDFRRPLGVALTGGAANASANVAISGISDVHSGLDAGNHAYSDNIGRVSTITTKPVKDNVKRIGTALSATEVLLDFKRGNFLEDGL